MTAQVLEYYAHNADPNTLEKATHYKYELEILEQLSNELGYQLKISTTPTDLSLTSDLYFVRWATSGIFPILASKIARSPSILFTGGSEVVLRSDNEIDNYYLEKPKWKQSLTRLSLQLATQTFVTSEYLASDVEEIAGIRPDVLHHFIDTEKFSPGVPTSLPSSVEQEDYVITISSLNDNHIKRKRLEFLLEVIANSDVVSNIVMLGIDRGGYNRLVRKTEELDITDQVHFMLNAEIDDKIDALRGARAAVLPTLHEGFGMAILEALSCGTPIITTPNGSVPEVCGDTVAYTSATDINEFQDTMDSVWKDQERRNEYSIQSRKRSVDLFSLSQGFTQYESIISDYLLNNH
ncbi:Glycosyltransferase involved in cell wall bisynthesis [Halorubrum xinjiangense]|uniref:Glycosyltransferase involved in cell wall bisynthesis n=1 Tax=Halorubrum xinjiangense TaxID=261291 RepID=A0A1G7HW14_9EURY|nr:glycosyltransferase family 4 protein [Halorubrum xinjiangense]SDF04632.1 Glycosyltransferase involved in cell wall bisynthesis [Halorubrum xinjiangense]